MCGSYGTRTLGQREHQFRELVRDLRDVGAQMVGHHCQSLLFDSATTLRAHKFGQPVANLIVARAYRLENLAYGCAMLVERGALVDGLLLVADDQNGGRRGCRGVERELVDLSQLLSLAHDNHLILTHHRYLTAEVHNRTHFAILAIDNHLSEGTLGLVEDCRAELFAQCVDEVALVAHQQVDRGETSRRNLTAQALVFGYAIAKFGFAALCHLVLY